MVPPSHQTKHNKGSHHLRDLRHKHKHHQFNSKKHRHLRREPSVVPDASVSDSFLEGEGVHKVAEQDASTVKVDGGEMEPLSASGSATASASSSTGVASDVEAATNALSA